jgi:hypothetical protein
MGEAGGGDTACLRRDIGPDRQRALRQRIDQAQQILRAAVGQSPDEAFLEFRKRRLDTVIAVGADRIG